jgi:hypothetical protein
MNIDAITTILTTGASVVFGLFLKLQKDYNDKLKIAYDEKVELLRNEINELKQKQLKYEQEIKILNNKVYLLQEEYDINIPVFFHKEDGSIIFQNKNGVGFNLKENDELLAFFKKIKRLKKATKEININGEDYLIASCLKEYPLNDIIVSFLFTK